MQRKELIIKLDKANSQYLILSHQGDCLGEFTRELVSINDSRLLSAQLLIPNKGSELIVIYKEKEVLAKQCTDCKRICKINEFHNSKSNFANKVPTCKNCVSNKNKRSINNSLTIEETKKTFIFKDQKSETETLYKHFELNTYNDLRAQRIIDGRGTNAIVLFESDNIVAKQCNVCNHLLLLAKFYKHDTGYGNCLATCESCIKNAVRRTEKIPLKFTIFGNTLQIECNYTNEIIAVQNFNVNFETNLSVELIIIEKKKINTILVYLEEKIIFKQCNKCKVIKDINEFHRSKRGYGNTHPNCKDCRNTTKVRRNIPLELVEINNVVIELKKCSSCSELKRLEKFREGGGPGNKKSTCLDCERAQYKEFRNKNKEIVSERKKRSYKKNKKLYIERAKINYYKDPETARERAREYYANNTDVAIENVKAWKRRNASKVKVYLQNYKSKKRMLENTLTLNELNEILDYFSQGCALTTDKDIHLDHFISLSTGHGGTFKGNIIPLKSSINLSKSANNPFEWIKLNDEYQNEFVKVVKYLALQNNLSVKDYTSFVCWCYENPRDEKEIEKDTRSSLQIWNNNH